MAPVNFDFWQRWGVDLDDVSFANAWLALGLARYRPTSHSVNDVNITNWSGPGLDWIFPTKDLQIQGTPEQWAQAWVDAAKRLGKTPVRLRVRNAPPDEPIRPWYRMLGEAQPAPASMSLLIEAPRAELYIDWPLRLGCLSESAENVLRSTAKKWPSSKITQTVRLGRENANCDVLVFPGTAKALQQDLLQIPWSIKANLVLLQGGDEAEWGEIEALLVAILAETHASGFILIPRELGDEPLAEMLNGILRELSHANPLDVALGEGIRKTKPGDVIAGFTRDVAAFVVPQLVERYNARIAALPPGTVLDMSAVGPKSQWLTVGVDGGGLAGGLSRDVAPPDADRHVAARSVSMRPRELMFDHEDQGSAAIAEVAAATAAASPPPEASAARAARFLQQRSFVRRGKEYQEAVNGFIVGVPALVRVRIAEPEQGWDVLPSAFPVEKLPQHLERWNLMVWLSEPDHLKAPIKRQIKLPRDGNSTECEFQFRPRAFPRFEGRLTVLHRGRVIQTAVLRAGVITTDPLAKGAAPKLEDPIALRHRLGDLDRRRQFDLAFVANHDAKGRPLLTAVSAKAAWVKELSRMPALSAEINKTLSPVAKSVQDYAKGLDGDKGEALLVQLAQHGGALKTFLYEALDDPSNNPKAAEPEFVQIVSTRSDAVVPLEFLYDYTVPQDGAKVCGQWRTALKDGKCPKTCDHTSGRNVCPMGFWGLRKVIERHAVRPGLAKDGNVLYLQSETSRESDTLYLGGVAVLGSSKRVPKASVMALKKLITQHCGAEPKIAKDWDQWEELVKELRPSMLVALPHTDGKNTNVTVEIGNGEDVKTITLRETHVFPPPVTGRQAPLVALIGCDTAGTADDYGNHVLFLRDRGAGIVIGTIATVFGEHAAQVAGKLVEGMLPREPAKPVRLGELMRAVRRNSLLAGLLMPLCLVAYGDADWILARKRADA